MHVATHDPFLFLFHHALRRVLLMFNGILIVAAALFLMWCVLHTNAAAAEAKAEAARAKTAI